MNTRNRTQKEIEIDIATTEDTINDAILSSAEVVYPNKKRSHKCGKIITGKRIKKN